jgi:membrane protease YdiL (CAAX protease family)
MNKKIIWFIIFVLLVSWGATFALKILHLSAAPMTAVMAFPMLLALAFMLIIKDEKLAAIGWKLPRLKYGLMGIFLPILQVGMILGLDYALGLISYNGQHILSHKPTPHVWLNVGLGIPGMFIPFILLSWPSLIIGWLNHLGEEFAWRGYLFRRMAKSGQRLVKAALISGLVWWAWHVPMFWLSPVLKPLHLWQIGLTLFLSLPSLIGTAALYSWIYLKSGSIWAPTVMHLCWNLYRGILTGRLADGAPGLFAGNLWIINGEGVVGMAVTAVIGCYFLRLMARLDKEKPGPNILLPEVPI